jgi:hypothetical protein
MAISGMEKRAAVALDPAKSLVALEMIFVIQ